jgi:hypothetical protein
MKKVFLVLAFSVSVLFTAALLSAPVSMTTDNMTVQILAFVGLAGLLTYSAFTTRKGNVSNIITNGFNPYRRITPGAKLIQVNDNLGNPNLKNNQGTTFEIYDYVPLATSAANQTLEFFAAVNAKIFPFTNLQQNQLQAGEALAIEYKFFTYMIVNDATGEVTAFGSISELIKGFNVGQYSMFVDNNRVMKPLTLGRQSKQFNPHGKTAENYVFFPDTDLTVPPQVQFTAKLTIPPVTSPAAEGSTLYVGLHWTGTGAILNIKQSV